MAYVDLNPVRAKLSDSIKHSDYTSGQDRWRQHHQLTNDRSHTKKLRRRPFVETTGQLLTDRLPFSLVAYLDLIDAAAKAIKVGSREIYSGYYLT
jgi:hypothetical protein